MDLKLLTQIGPLVERFQPLIKLAGRTSGSVSEQELTDIARALLSDPEGNLDNGAREAFVGLLGRLRDAAPSTPVLSLLGSPEAAKVYNTLLEAQQKRMASEPVSMFCRCPGCALSFETELQSQT